MDENQNSINNERSLPGDRQGASGVSAGSDSMQAADGTNFQRVRIGSPEEETLNSQNNTQRLVNISVNPTSSLEPPRMTIASLVQETDVTRKRIKWSTEMNKYVIENYFRVTENETNLIGYRQKLHQIITSEYPHLGLTEQNIADRKNAIIKKKLLPPPILEEIKAKIAQEIELENIEIRTNTHIQTNTIDITETPQDNINANNTNTDDTTHTYDITTYWQIQTIDKLKLEYNTAKTMYKGIKITERPYLTKQHNSKKLTHLIKLTNKYIIEPQITHIKNINDIRDIIYFSAIAIVKTNNGKIIDNKNTTNPSNPKTKKNNISVPKWQYRLEKKVEGLRKDIARMYELKNKNNNTHKNKFNKQIKYIKSKHKLHTKYDHTNETIEEYLDTIKQKLSVTTNKLKKYKKSYSRKQDNKLFQRNEKQFYRQMKDENPMYNTSTPNIQQQEEFWANIWANSIEHNKKASFIPHIINQTQNIEPMNTPIITIDIFQKIIKKLQNWKAPGPDNIQNFWIKKFTAIHPILLTNINKYINNPDEIPPEICQGNTYLKPKVHIATDPSQYRPITCLNTIYKLFTACITELLTKHIEENNIIAEEQKGSRRHTQGCKEQLTIDATILHTSRKTKRQMHACFIDYVKAYDSVPHTWLLEILQIYKVHPTIQNFLKTVMKNWSTKLIINHQISKTIAINRGIFQGDSLSSLWFCLSINPLSTLLNQTKGFKIGHQQKYNLTHLFYIDDLKIYAESQQDLKLNIETCERFSKDIKMEFGINKCKIQSITNGKINKNIKYKTETKKTIDAIDAHETYKYLGIQQSNGVEHSKIKSTIKSKFTERLQQIAKRSLNAKNLTKAINTFAIPSLTYTFGIIKWSQTELDELDMKIRTILTKNKYHHPKSSIQRINLPRKMGGRGIINIKNLHNKTINRLREYFDEKKETSHLIKAIASFDHNYTPLDLAQTHNPIAIQTYEDMLREWTSKPLHGKYITEVNNPNVDKNWSFNWLTEGSLFAETEGFLIAIQDQVVPTRNYMKTIVRNPQTNSDKCRKCNELSETTHHILAGCKNLCQMYKDRHDKVGHIIHKKLAEKYDLITIEQKNQPHWIYKPQTIIENKKAQIYWDRTILTNKTTTANRPDTVLHDKQTDTLYIIDYAVVNNNNLNSTYNNKITKYTQIAQELKETKNAKQIQIIPIIISTTGVITEELKKNLKTLGITENTIQKLQRSVILSSTNIMRNVIG